MKELIKHLVTCNMEQIVNRSLAHCHAENVHSIMLLECPGKTIRLFIADPNHKLCGNFPSKYKEEQSVGFHAHHCELTLIPLTSNIFNWRVEKRKSTEDIIVGEYSYKSKITHGEIGFTYLNDTHLSTNTFSLLQESCYMPAEQMHTIAIRANQFAAWFALEGRENPNHDGHCFSSQKLDKQDFSSFYKPMFEEDILDYLRQVNLI